MKDEEREMRGEKWVEKGGGWYAYGVASALRCRAVFITNTAHTHLHSSFPLIP